MAQLFASVYVGPFIQQVANYLQIALPCGQKERQAAATTRIDSCAGKMKPTHATEVSIHRRLGERSLSLLSDQRHAVHDRQREAGRGQKGDCSPEDRF